MRYAEPQQNQRDLTGSQAAQLLREGRLGAVLIHRAESQVDRHRSAAGDQASALRRAVRAHNAGRSTTDGAAA